MKQFYWYFKTVRTDLKILLFLALLTYFLIYLVLNHYNEIFDGAYEIGIFFTKISISYISAFIFYFIVVHIKNQKDKDNISEFIGLNIYAIITNAHLMILGFKETENKKINYKDIDINSNEFGKLLSKINRFTNESPLVNQTNEPYSWVEYWEYLKKGTFENLEEIYKRGFHIDTELIKLLSRIEHSVFYLHWNNLYSKSSDVSFKIYELQLRSYLTHINDLEKYAEKNLKKYQYRSHDFMGTKSEWFYKQ